MDGFGFDPTGGLADQQAGGGLGIGGPGDFGIGSPGSDNPVTGGTTFDNPGMSAHERMGVTPTYEELGPSGGGSTADQIMALLGRVNANMPPIGIQLAGSVVPGANMLMAGQAIARALGLPSTVNENEVGLGAFGGGEDRGSEPYRAPTAVQQAIQKAIQGGRGAIGAMPEFLRPELTGLSPFQQRAAIGTYGTSGESGRYRAPETIDYYKSLVENTLRNEMGVPIGSPLPIEWQYLREVLGVSPPETTDAFLGALTNYQAPI